MPPAPSTLATTPGSPMTTASCTRCGAITPTAPTTTLACQPGQPTPITFSFKQKTAYEIPSRVTPYGYDAGGFWRIAPGDVAHSSIPWTASRRDGVTQMPPIGTHLV